MGQRACTFKILSILPSWYTNIEFIILIVYFPLGWLFLGQSVFLTSGITPAQEIHPDGHLSISLPRPRVAVSQGQKWDTFIDVFFIHREVILPRDLCCLERFPVGVALNPCRGERDCRAKKEVRSYFKMKGPESDVIRGHLFQAWAANLASPLLATTGLVRGGRRA